MKTIKKPYIIGETAFHHEGDEKFILDLINHGIELGLDAMKFHLTLDLDDYMIKEHEAINIIKPWCFNSKQWDRILGKVKNMDIILLCNDVKSIEYAIESKYRIKAIEIHATGLNDIFLLEKASKFEGTVILGTGGSSLDEIDFAISFLKEKEKKDIFLMHGFQNYPTNPKDIKLERMNKLSKLFDLPVGYADHTDPFDKNNEYISCLGIAKGFNVLEKHFTHKFNDKRIDAQAAVSIEQMKKIMDISKVFHNVVGQESSLTMSEAELKYGNTGPMKKAIVAREFIKKGSILTIDNIAFKRTNESSNIKQNELFKILGNKTLKNIQKDEIIDLKNIEFNFKPSNISQFKNTAK